MPHPEYPPAGRARAKLLAEQIRNITRHFAWQPHPGGEHIERGGDDPIHMQTHSEMANEESLAHSPSHSHSRRVFSLAWPVIGENFLQTLLGIVDTLMVASLGAAALAGVGAGIQIMYFVIAALSATSVGSSVLVAQAVGAKNLAQASIFARQSLVWSVLISIPLIVFGLVAAESIIGVFGMEADVNAIGTEYLRVTMGTVVVLTLLILGGGVLRGAGDSRTPMLVTALANLVNIILSYGLIFGEFGMPELGAVGSAWGTFLSRIVGFLILFGVLWKGKNGVSIRGRTGWWPSLGTARELLRIGIPAAIEQILTNIGFLSMTIVVAALGTEALAAQRIVFNALSISFLPGIGFGLAATALVGQSTGAKEAEAARIVGRISTLWATIWMGGLGLLFILFRFSIMDWFTDDPAVIAIGMAGFWPLAITQPFWAIIIVQSGALRGAGETQYPLRVNVIGVWSGVLLGYLFVTLFEGGLSTIWSSFMITGPFSAWLLSRRFRQLI
ncbi:MAG: MATE family efflux transporter [Chloroflexota bacterium]